MLSTACLILLTYYVVIYLVRDPNQKCVAVQMYLLNFALKLPFKSISCIKKQNATIRIIYSHTSSSAAAVIAVNQISAQMYAMIL